VATCDFVVDLCVCLLVTYCPFWFVCGVHVTCRWLWNNIHDDLLNMLLCLLYISQFYMLSSVLWLPNKSRMILKKNRT